MTRVKTALVLGALVVLVLLPLRGLLRNQGPPMEEGFMLVFPERVLKGDLPNRDFLHLYGPGSLWALAGTFKAFGTSLTVERLFGLAQQMLIVAGVYLIARRWGRLAAFACAAASIIIIMPPIGLTALAWVGAVGLGLLAFVAGLRAAREADERVRRRFLILAGVLAGACLLFRLDLILALALGGIALLPALARKDRVTLLVSFAATSALYLIHLVTAGFGNVIRGMVLDPVVYLRGGRRLSIPPPPDRIEGFLQRAAELREIDWPIPKLDSPVQLTVWFVVLVLSVVALALTGWWLLHRDRASVRGRILFTAGLFSVGILPQAIQRTDSTHFAWVSCVPLALMPVVLVEWSRFLPWRWTDRTRNVVAGALVLGLLVFVIPRYTVQQYTDYVAQTFGKHREAYRIERDGRVFYYGKREVAEALPELIADLDRYSEAGDSLLVGTTDLRKTPYSDAFLYYLFPELEPATYYIEMDPGVANAEDSELADEVRAADFLVLSAVWDDWEEPNDSREFGSNEPNEVVDEHFCLLGEYRGQYELYERCR
jgi:hypothetical protein